MEQLLKTFGVQPVLLLAQIVNFLIIFWLLKKFAYKPIFKVLEKRQKLIEDGVQNAQKSEEVLQRSLEKEKALLKKAQLDASQILSDTQKQAQEMLSLAEENTKKRVERMLEDGKKEIEEQTTIAQKQLAHQTARIAVEILEKSLLNVVDAKTQKEIVGNAIKKLKS